MKKVLCRFSIILPIVMLFIVFLYMPTISIIEIGLYLDRRSVELLYIALTVVWLCCSPLRKACCTGDIMEVFFNLVPLEVVGIITCAQYEFYVVVFLIILMVALQYLTIRKMREEQKCIFSEKRHRSYTHGIQRTAILISAVICSIPCFISFFVYGLKSPTYEAEEGLWEIRSENGIEETTTTEEEPNPYEKNRELLLCFDDDIWENLSIQQRINVAQEFVDFQSELLGIPTIHVTAEKLELFTLGEYSGESNEIRIDVEHLATAPAEMCLRTLVHETWHSAQHYLIRAY